MDTKTLLIIDTIALAVCIIGIVILLILWLKAEQKVFKLGGESWVYKLKSKDGKEQVPQYEYDYNLEQKMNYSWFMENLDDLYERFPEKWIVIKGQSVLAAYDQFREAFDWSLEELKIGTFLIQKVTKNQNKVLH